MNGSKNFLDAWKTRAEARRQAIAQALNRKPANPAVAPLRDLYIKRIQTVMNNRKDWVEAYSSHIKGLTNILSNPSTASSTSSSKGSLGDS
jgi:hypothetical protein